MLKILYFARLRDDLDTQEETLQLPQEVTNIGDLRDYLCQRGEPWNTALRGSGIFMAVNQQVSTPDTPLRGNEEVAFYPPVTGG